MQRAIMSISSSVDRLSSNESTIEPCLFIHNNFNSEEYNLFYFIILIKF